MRGGQGGKRGGRGATGWRARRHPHFGFKSRPATATPAAPLSSSISCSSVGLPRPSPHGHSTPHCDRLRDSRWRLGQEPSHSAMQLGVGRPVKAEREQRVRRGREEGEGGCGCGVQRWRRWSEAGTGEGGVRFVGAAGRGAGSGCEASLSSLSSYEGEIGDDGDGGAVWTLYAGWSSAGSWPSATVPSVSGCTPGKGKGNGGDSRRTDNGPTAIA